MEVPETNGRGLCATVGAAARRDATAGGALRWWCGVGLALLVGTPFGLLLSYAAALPFFLGLFFFALFGLLIGSAAFRVSRSNAPYAPMTVFLGTVLLVAWPLTISIVSEAFDFPANMAEKASREVRTIGTRSAAQFRADVASQVRDWVKQKYPPGGAIGYVRWVLSSGEIPKGELTDVPKALTRKPVGVWWGIRVVLSAGLLTFGVFSVTGQLRKAVTPRSGTSATEVD